MTQLEQISAIIALPLLMIWILIDAERAAMRFLWGDNLELMPMPPIDKFSS